jgi:hypothetical protein
MKKKDLRIHLENLIEKSELLTSEAREDMLSNGIKMSRIDKYNTELSKLGELQAKLRHLNDKTEKRLYMNTLHIPRDINI